MAVSSYRPPSPRGEGAPKGRIGHRRDEREWERASQVRCLREHPIHRSAPIYIKSEARLRIILAPSSGRGRRAKRGGVGIPACEKPHREPTSAPSGTSFQRKEGVCRLPASSFRAKARNLFRLRSRKDVRRGITGNTVLPTTSSRIESQPPPLRGTSFQRKEGEKRSVLTGN